MDHELKRIIEKCDALLKEVGASQKPNFDEYIEKVSKIKLPEEGLLEDRLLELARKLREIDNEMSEAIDTLCEYLKREEKNIRKLKGAEQYAKELAEKHPEGGRILSMIELVEENVRNEAYRQYDKLLKAVKEYIDSGMKLLEEAKAYVSVGEFYNREIKKLIEEK